VTGARRMQWAECATPVEKIIGEKLVAKTEEVMMSLEKPRHRCESNIKARVKEMGCERSRLHLYGSLLGHNAL
jgi:hypothetical protein